MWKSLFSDFTQKEYDEFIEFGDNGEKAKFSLSAYILLRSLLCDRYNIIYLMSEFKETTENKIREDLFEIKDILEKKGIYLWS